MAHLLVPLSGTAFPLALPDAIERTAYLVVVMLVVLLGIVLQFVQVRALFGGGDSTPHEHRTNCPSCGARTSVHSETCRYCDEPIRP